MTRSSQADQCQSYHVAWFVAEEVQSDVTVQIQDGRLQGVKQGRSTDAIELGDVALVTGLVNTHTHLEFSQLPEPIATEGRFTDWIRAVIQYRQAHGTEVHSAIQTGILESIKAGTTILGDIATSGWSADDYTMRGFQGVVFQELLGLSPARILQQSSLGRSHVQPSSRAFRPGISPHAPYSTHWELVQEAVELSRATGSVVAMHLAETVAEIELLASGTGEFKELLTELGLWQDEYFCTSRRPLDYLQLLAQAPRSLVIHGNYLTEEELRFIAGCPQMSLIYCPRTHAAFGHPTHPWRRLRELGGRVALGTDSRASNPDLSLFAELQFLAVAHPEESHFKLLQLGSDAGYEALGLSSLEADITLIQLAETKARTIENTLFNEGNRVCGTMIGGEWVWTLERGSCTIFPVNTRR